MVLAKKVFQREAGPLLLPLPRADGLVVPIKDHEIRVQHVVTGFTVQLVDVLDNLNSRTGFVTEVDNFASDLVSGLNELG